MIFMTGQVVWVRGKGDKQYSIKGTIQIVDPYRREAIYGIRLASGTFTWATVDQLKLWENKI